MLLVAEKTGVCQCQAQQGWLHIADHMADRVEQTGVPRDVVHHHLDHFQTQGLTHTMAGATQLLPNRRQGARLKAKVLYRLLLPQPDALHHLVELVHLLQNMEGRRHGHLKIRLDHRSEAV